MPVVFEKPPPWWVVKRPLSKEGCTQSMAKKGFSLLTTPHLVSFPIKVLSNRLEKTKHTNTHNFDLGRTPRTSCWCLETQCDDLWQKKNDLLVAPSQPPHASFGRVGGSLPVLQAQLQGRADNQPQNQKPSCKSKSTAWVSVYIYIYVSIIRHTKRASSEHDSMHISPAT